MASVVPSIWRDEGTVQAKERDALPDHRCYPTSVGASIGYYFSSPRSVLANDMVFRDAEGIAGLSFVSCIGECLVGSRL